MKCIIQQIKYKKMNKVTAKPLKITQIKHKHKQNLYIHTNPQMANMY